MPNTLYPPSVSTGPSEPSASPNPQQLRRSVGQDKSTTTRERRAITQPVPLSKAMRSRGSNTNIPRSHKQFTKRKTVPLMLWVSPAVKAEIQRLAEKERLSISSVGRALLEDAIRQSIHRQYASLIQPIIEQTIAKQMRMVVMKLTWLFVRIAFDGGQTRSLVTNLLGRQPGMTPALLNDILDGSAKTARSNILKRTPQITALITAVEQWLREEEPKVNG